VEDEAFDDAVAASVKAGASKRSTNYTEKEDIALINMWESISLDMVTDNDQSGKKYWQRIEGKFHRLRSKMGEGENRMMRSFQGRYGTIKTCSSRWAACLEKVKNNRPNGATIDDLVSHFFPSSNLFHCNVDYLSHFFALFFAGSYCSTKIKNMKASENQVFTSHHCWKILEHSEKWKLRDQKAPPPPRTGATISLDDDSDDASTGGRNKGRLDV
jgi:hypothetical protein